MHAPASNRYKTTLIKSPGIHWFLTTLLLRFCGIAKKLTKTTYVICPHAIGEPLNMVVGSVCNPSTPQGMMKYSETTNPTTPWGVKVTGSQPKRSILHIGALAPFTRIEKDKFYDFLAHTLAGLYSISYIPRIFEFY